MSITNKLAAGLGLALAVSVVGHIAGGYAYLQQRDASVEARTDLRHQQGATEAASLAANACSESVEALSVCRLQSWPANWKAHAMQPSSRLVCTLARQTRF